MRPGGASPGSGPRRPTAANSTPVAAVRGFRASRGQAPVPSRNAPAAPNRRNAQAHVRPLLPNMGPPAPAPPPPCSAGQSARAVLPRRPENSLRALALSLHGTGVGGLEAATDRPRPESARVGTGRYPLAERLRVTRYARRLDVRERRSGPPSILPPPIPIACCRTPAR